jgi:cytochrome c oxidase assembly factor 2
MPPMLHPRSRSTSSLFAATIFASFVIVGIPHIFPCPAPRRTLADSEMIMTADGQQIPRPRRKRKAINTDDQSPKDLDTISMGLRRSTSDDEVSRFLQLEAEAESMAKLGRECPVPKPSGVLGKWLGFTDRDREQQRDGSHTGTSDRERGGS